MCWTNDSLNKKVCKRSFKVFKIVKYDGEEISSYFQDFSYVLGREEKLGTPLIPTVCNYAMPYSYYIAEGFHSYNLDISFIINKYSTILCYNLHKDFYDLNCAALLCTIPKGAIYYENDNYEIVSDRIIPEKIISWNKLEKLHNRRKFWNRLKIWNLF